MADILSSITNFTDDLLTIAGSTAGKLVKLSFIAFKGPKFTDMAPVPPFQVMFNPATFSEKLSVQYEPNEAVNSNGNDQKFNKQNATIYSFEFILDGTGAIDPSHKLIPVSVRIENLKRVVYDYTGATHRPNYVKIWYGTLLYCGVCESLDINYTLFNSAGLPLRAKVTVQFMEAKASDFMQLVKNNQSPDVTHERSFKDHNTLPGLSNEIFERNDLYAKVARANDMNNFRRVSTGTSVYFPPIAK